MDRKIQILTLVLIQVLQTLCQWKYSLSSGYYVRSEATFSAASGKTRSGNGARSGNTFVAKAFHGGTLIAHDICLFRRNNDKFEERNF